MFLPLGIIMVLKAKVTSLKYINIREKGVPVFSPVTHTNKYPGEEVELPLNLAKEYMKKGYVEITD